METANPNWLFPVRQEIRRKLILLVALNILKLFQPDPGVDEMPATKFKGNSAVDFVDPGRSGRYTLKK